jgi:hypothetical protein
MRDERGRYVTSKAIEDNGPEWASGCPNCAFGIANAPDLTGAVSVGMERMVQAIESNGRIFCTCRAGINARKNLKNLKQRLIEEARRMPLAREHGYDSAPDIEISRQLIDKARAKNVPNIHFDERVPA